MELWALSRSGCSPSVSAWPAPSWLVGAKNCVLTVTVSGQGFKSQELLEGWRLLVLLSLIEKSHSLRVTVHSDAFL